MAVNRKSIFKIIEINVSSLISLERRQNLNTFINMHQPHAILLVETVLQSSHHISFPNYNFIRTDKNINQNGRGTGILLKNNIKFEQINSQNLNLQSLEITAVRIQTEDNQNILLISAYRRTAPPFNIFDTSDLDTIMALKNNINRCKLILGGDLNARHSDWLNTTNCASGQSLARWLTNNSFTEHIQLTHTERPTFYRGGYSSYLDVFLISENINIVFPDTSPTTLSILDFPSDHRAVELVIDIKSRPIKTSPVTFPNYGRTNWKRFNVAIDSGLQSISISSNTNMSRTQIDQAIQDVTSLINATIEEVVPKISLKNPKQMVLPTELQHIISEKNRLRRRWQRRNYDPHEVVLKSEINLLEKIIRDRLKILHTEHWQKQLSDIKLDNHTFANIRKFTKSKKTNVVFSLKPNQLSPTLTSDSLEKTNILGKHYEAVHHQNNTIGVASFTAAVSQYVHVNIAADVAIRTLYTQHSTSDPSFAYDPEKHLVSINQVKAAIKTRANKKSKGNDNISNFVIKRLSPKFHTWLAILINQAYNIAYFPTAWKTAIIIPIIKKNKPNYDPASYRPISLLSCLGKIYEYCIKQALDAECERLKIIPDDQFCQKSVLHPLVKFTNDITTSINTRIPTIACTLDIEKAFDTVWTDGLIFKMHSVLGMDTHLCCFIKNYLHERKFKVMVEGKLSATFPIANGVPQGGVLSSLLYSIYLSDLPLPPQHINPIQRLQYADDILIYVSVQFLVDGQHRLNAYLSDLIQFFEKWKIRINPTKAEAIVFKGTNKQHSRNTNFYHEKIVLNIENQQIIPQRSLKYLGVIFSKKPTFVAHVTEALKRSSNAFYYIKHILRATSKLNINIKLLCYKQLIRPILCYGFPAWSGISSHQMERIRCFERKCIRACINYKRSSDDFRHISNESLYNQGLIKRIDCFMIDNMLKTFEYWPTIPLLSNCIEHNPTSLNNRQMSYKPPYYIQHLYDTNQLYINSVPILYHTRHNKNTQHLGHVYSTAVPTL